MPTTFDTICITCEYFSIVKLSVTLTVLSLETFPASFLPKSNNIKCSESSFLSLSKSFAKKLSSLVFFPLGLVPAIGLTVILLSKSPLDIYKKLRVTNPSPFMYFFNFSDFQIIGASPEILVRLRDNKITVRPIAGTRPRGKNIKEDNFFAKDLLKDKKELSEHLM